MNGSSARYRMLSSKDDLPSHATEVSEPEAADGRTAQGDDLGEESSGRAIPRLSDLKNRKTYINPQEVCSIPRND